MRKVKYHVDIQRIEYALGTLQPSNNFLPAAVGCIAPHLAKQRIVEALNTHGQPVHAHFLETPDRLRYQVIGVGLDTNLLNRK